MIRSLEPETLLSTHTRPIHGKEKIKENINPFMDGIAFILPGKNDYGRTSIGNP
jgi:hypothetical protein